MTGDEREARRLRTLLARLGRDLELTGAAYDRVRSAAEEVEAHAADHVLVAGTALYLQHFYTGIEDLLKRIASELDGAVPEGDEWHRELLAQLEVEVPGVRPAVLGKELRADLDHLRRFRHRVPHAYAEAYDWEEMQDVLVSARRSSDGLSAALERLRTYLGDTIDSLEGAGE